MITGGTLRTNSFSFIKQTARTTGTELRGSLLLLAWLVRKPLLRLMLFSPLLHLRHLLLLSLCLLSLRRPATHHLWLLRKPILRLMLLSPLLDLRHLGLLGLGRWQRVERAT